MVILSVEGELGEVLALGGFLGGGFVDYLGSFDGFFHVGLGVEVLGGGVGVEGVVVGGVGGVVEVSFAYWGGVDGYCWWLLYLLVLLGSVGLGVVFDIGCGCCGWGLVG